MTCEVCGHNAFHADSVERTFHVGKKLVLVEAIPAESCDRCGAANFTAEVAEQLRVLVQTPSAPVRRLQADVLHFNAA